MHFVWSMIVWVVSWLAGWAWWGLGWVWWIASYLLWTLAWLVLPLAVLAYVAMRVAERFLGRTVVQGWIRQRTSKWGIGLGQRVGRGVVALSMLPGRVLFWLVVYTLWHSVLNLIYTPRWRPWSRAWGRRWRPANAARRSS